MVEAPKPQQQVRVTRTELPTPSLADPTAVTIQIQYQVGMLPPRFIYMAKRDWNAAKEALAIKADLAKTLQPPGEMITI